MEKFERCASKYLERLFKNHKNKNDLKTLNTITKDLDNSEVYMETCLEKEGFQKYAIFSEKSSERVKPIRLEECDSSFASHTHPKDIAKGFGGKSEFSLPDRYFAYSSLLEPEDPLSIFCVQGLEDRKIKCIINPKKLECSRKDNLLEREFTLD